MKNKNIQKNQSPCEARQLSNVNCQMLRKGFSLVEVIISIAILTMGIAAISMLMASNIKNAQAAKDEVIAMSLAQEGIELVRNIRDGGNADWTIDWATLKGKMSSVGSLYDNSRIDSQYWPSNFVWSDSSDKRLYLNASGFYTHNTAGSPAPTKFYRKLIFSKDASDTVTAVGVVTWDSAGNFPSACTVANKCLSVTSLLPDTTK